jgi:hypothetical protein
VKPTGRLLPGVLRLRDVPDVEERVRETLTGFGHGPGTTDHDELVLDAIGLAFRIERALPPGHELEPVLQRVLDFRLASRASRLGKAA